MVAALLSIDHVRRQMTTGTPEPGQDLLVSIVTPSYNQAAFLSETIRSVVEQDYPRIEYIVMDGGSTDGSLEIIERWAQRHRIIWRSERDRGQGDAIQRGAELATGEIFAWLNSDDVYLDRAVVSDVVAVFREGAQIVSGAGWYIDEHGERIAPIPVYADRLTHDRVRFADWFLQPATFVRRELFLTCPIDLGLHWAFDWDLFIRLTTKAPGTPILRPLAGYRLHPTGKTISGGGRRQLELLEVIRRYHGRLSAPYLLLLPIVAAHLIAERLPRRVYGRVNTVLNTIAAVTQRFTNGRGIAS